MVSEREQIDSMVLHALPCSGVAARLHCGRPRPRAVKVQATFTQERPTQAAPGKFANQLEALKSMSTARRPARVDQWGGIAAYSRSALAEKVYVTRNSRCAGL